MRSTSGKLFIETGIGVQLNRYRRSVFVDMASPEISITPIPNIGGQPFGTIRGSMVLRDAEGNLVVNDIGEPVFPERSENLGETTTCYVRIPVIVGTGVMKGRLLLRAGLVADIIARATEYKELYSYYSGIQEYKDASTKGFSKIMAGGVVRTTYLLTKRIGVDVGYHRSFTRIYSSNEGAGPYYNIFSVGGTYYFSDLINK